MAGCAPPPIVRKMNPCLLNRVIQGRPRCPGSEASAGLRLESYERPRSLPRGREEPGSRAVWCLELAKLHTALAQVAATALNSDGREWIDVAGRRFSSPDPTSHR